MAMHTFSFIWLDHKVDINNNKIKDPAMKEKDAIGLRPSYFLFITIEGVMKRKKA